jgi:hypothetical protein
MSQFEIESAYSLACWFAKQVSTFASLSRIHADFFFSVRVRIIWVQVSRPALFAFVCSGFFRMRAQIVPESDVTPGMWRICSEKVKPHQARARLIGERAISPSSDAKLAMPNVAECFDLPPFPVEVGQIGDVGHQVHDRLGGQPRHRRRSDMMHDRKGWTEDLQTLNAERCHLWPFGIIGNENHWNRGRHAHILEIDEARFKPRHRHPHLELAPQ